MIERLHVDDPRHILRSSVLGWNAELESERIRGFVGTLGS